MSLSRRDFLRVGSMMGLSTAAFGSLARLAFGQHRKAPGDELDTGVGFAVPRTAHTDALATINMAAFQKAIGAKFTFAQGRTKMADMTLDQVIDLNPPSLKGNSTSTRQCFSLVFNRLSRTPLTQDTYTVSSVVLGTFQLFIVPGYQSPSVSHYEAVINRVYP
jgi:hypothetical protein